MDELTDEDWAALAAVPVGASQVAFAPGDPALVRFIEQCLVRTDTAIVTASGAPGGVVLVHALTDFGQGVVAAARVLVPLRDRAVAAFNAVEIRPVQGGGVVEGSVTYHMPKLWP